MTMILRNFKITVLKWLGFLYLHETCKPTLGFRLSYGGKWCGYSWEVVWSQLGNCYEASELPNLLSYVPVFLHF